ncbi:MAG: FAD-binding protein, partial [Acidimicrobiales bacterium]
LERRPLEPVSGHSGPNSPSRSSRKKWSGDRGDGHEAVIARLEEMGLLPGARPPAGDDPPPLEHAGVVVAGGRGLGDAGAFAMVEELARLLGGAPAASGGAVASGWAPSTWLVGQTAATIGPDLYLAFGISGASQHLAGIGRAGHVIAVTDDATAPILAVADLAVIGDPRRVLSLLVGRLGGGPNAG